MAFRTLRDLYGRIDEHLWTLAGRAAQLVEWIGRTSTAAAAAPSPSTLRASERGAARCAATPPSRASHRP